MLKHIPFYGTLLGRQLTTKTKATHSHVLIYGAIEAHSMGEKGCIASNKLIAQETGLKESSVKTVISTLAKAGWIKVYLNENNHRKGIDPLMDINPPLIPINEKGQNNRGDLSPRTQYENKKYKKDSESSDFDFGGPAKQGQSSAAELLQQIIDIVNPREKVIESRLRLLNGRLKDYTADEILRAARAFSKSEWHKENGQMLADNLLAPSKFGRWYEAGQKLGKDVIDKEREHEKRMDQIDKENADKDWGF